MSEIALARVEELEVFCSSEELSLAGLQERVEGLAWTDLRNSSFLHHVCMNRGVSLGPVEFLLRKYPESARIVETNYFEDMYPIHCACSNELCPDSVIQLLVTENPSAMAHHGYMSTLLDKCDGYVEEIQGLPLHHFLSRCDHLTLDTAELLVNTHPEALRTPTDDQHGLLPIHVILCKRSSFRSPNDIVQYLIETEPFSARIGDALEYLPLHDACANGSLTVDTFQLLINAFPDALLQAERDGNLPIHILCQFLYRVSDEIEALRTLALFVETSPASVRQTCNGGYLPIYHAANAEDPECFKLLLDQFPESARIEMGGNLLIHRACQCGHFNTVQYLLQSYPESINIRNNQGLLPIHTAAASHDNGEYQEEILKLLVSRDPSGASKRTTECNSLPLHLVCSSAWSAWSAWRFEVAAAAVLFDAHPEALRQHDGNSQSPLDLARMKRELIAFLEANLIHSQLAEDAHAMATRDLNGRLPLHGALCDNATLGAIKLLVRGNPAALEDPDYSGSFPLHLACEFCGLNVVQFLLEIEDGPLDRCDGNGDFPLHFACRGGNFNTVNYLLESIVGLRLYPVEMAT